MRGKDSTSPANSILPDTKTLDTSKNGATSAPKTNTCYLVHTYSDIYR